jgi:hypothetical protein
MHTLKRLIASTLIASITAMGLPLSAQAGMVSTEEAVTTITQTAQRNQVTAFLQRADVATALQGQGVSSQDALNRVQALSDAEIDQLAGRIEQAPVGGEVLGLLFTVFIVLLVTDILGFTKVFPFTRSVR